MRFFQYVLVHSLKDANYTLTLQSVKDVLSKRTDEISKDSKKQQTIIDLNDWYMKLETILSTRLPAERYSNYMNMLRVFTNPDSTSEEIQNALVN